MESTRSATLSPSDRVDTAAHLLEKCENNFELYCAVVGDESAGLEIELVLGIQALAHALIAVAETLQR